MNQYETKNIRNIALLGHAGSGKTSLAEAFLLDTATINRRGTVEEHSTQSDYNEIEHERGCSLFTTPLCAEFEGVKLNILDTPGYDDYIGELIAATSVVENSIISMNAQNTVEVGTENAWHYSSVNNVPVMFLVNKLDVDQAKFDDCVQQAKDIFSRKVTVLQYPLHTGATFNSIIDIMTMSLYEYPAGGGKATKKAIPESEMAKAEAYHAELVDAIAETDEELMNKYFENGALDEADLNAGLKKALAERQIFPLFAASSKLNYGTDLLLNFIKNVCPSPADMPGKMTVDDNFVKFDSLAQNSLFIYKMSSEAHLGDMTFFKVISGRVTAGTDLVNEQKSQSERLNQIFVMNGKKRIEIPTLVAGDLGATVKLKSSQINHTLHEKGYNVEFAPITYPNSRIRIAVSPKNKGEEEKIGMGLHSLHQEDPTLVVEHSQELRQMILYAQGELHLSAAKWRLEHRYKVESEFIEPRVPYRETIQKQVRGMYRHKKQSGGAGQFAEVHMLMEPWAEDAPMPTDITVRGKDLMDLDWGGKLEYVNCIVGGVIDQRFLPAILKGVMEKMTIGPLTGCYVRDIRIAIYDGKMHPVDSNEAAFKTAGRMAFRDNFVKADPKVLEPIYNVEIKVPDEFVGDIMSDLPTRRGIILGIESIGRYQLIKARMPMAELDKYSTALRSMTQARATHRQEFAEYQVVPAQVQMKLIEEYKKRQEAEEE